MLLAKDDYIFTVLKPKLANGMKPVAIYSEYA